MSWFGRLSPAQRRIKNIIFVLLIAFSSAYVLLQFIVPNIINSANFTKLTTTEAIASVAVIVTVTIAAINLITASVKKRYSSKKQLALSVNVQGNKVIITSTIENKGTERIVPKSFYLFINAGEYSKKEGYSQYEFPNILKHECGEFDCALAKRCKANRINKIPDELLGDTFKNKLSVCSVLNHIASDSVNFIDPGEVFSEDMIFELEPGVYRVILVGVTVKTDCMCAHKIFVVEDKK